MPNKNVLLIVVLTILVVGGGVYYWNKTSRPVAQTAADQQPLIGGDKDTGGCLIGAGYSWCEARQECVRVWETYCTATAPKTAVFNCTGGKTITAVFYPGDDKFVDLDLGGDRKMSIPRALSASGARYAKADESFVFWNKGDTAFITENGAEAYSNCVIKSE